MSCCTYYMHCILTILIFLVTTSSGEDADTSESATNITEKVFQFTLRTFTTKPGVWVTQVQMQRYGFPEEGEVPPVQFSVEQNRTNSKYPPRLIAHVEAASHPDDEIDEIFSEGFTLVLRPGSGWLAAKIFCRYRGDHLALPTAEARDWLTSILQMESLPRNVTEVYVGISNITPDFSFQTVLGQNVSRDLQFLMDDTDVKCGVLDLSNTPPTVRFDYCLVHRPYMCENMGKQYPDTFELS